MGECSAAFNKSTSTCESFYSRLSLYFQNTHFYVHLFSTALIEVPTFTFIKLNSNSINKLHNFQNSVSKSRHKYFNRIIVLFK